LVTCSNDQIQSSVSIGVTELDSNRTIVGIGSGTMPGGYFCTNAVVSTNFNGGC
jgi:hypothetical protein